tara:strand:- start:568 stop:759 length:192 start_codon:yes stop_codon:yes gene_type:complete
MKEKETAASGGIGLSWILFIVFLILKLTGEIAWSWVWIFAPLWIPVAIAIVFVIFLLVAAYYR